MISLRTKVLLALLVSTVLALLVSAMVARASLRHGFELFLQQQEETQLRQLLPELAELYQRRGSWDELANQPRRWMRLLVQTRPQGIRPPPDFPAEFRPEHARPRPGSGPSREHKQLQPEVWHLWRRLFLLDSRREWVAGAREGDFNLARMAAVRVNGETVGWVGFHAAGASVAPEARHFLAYQRRALFWSLLIAALVTTVLGFVLARHLTRPVGQLRDTVRQLTAGDFAARATVKSRDEIGVLAHHVNRMAETLEKNETARRRWTADIAHELRTPLAILTGELEALQDGIRPVNAASLASLTQEVKQLARLVDDLQTLALADAGALGLQWQTVDFSQLVAQVVAAWSERVQAAGLQCSTQLPASLELPADPQRLRQILHNVLENACRYTLAGGTVQLTLESAGRWAVLQIDDSAPGVAEEHRARLFERLYRGDESRSRTSGGSGLGLAICDQIVTAHGGRIEASASALGGLCLRILLPLQRNLDGGLEPS